MSRQLIPLAVSAPSGRGALAESSPTWGSSGLMPWTKCWLGAPSLAMGDIHAMEGTERRSVGLRREAAGVLAG